MPRPRDHPPDVPAHLDDSPLSVSFDGQRCTRCGVTSNPPHQAVADFPDPTSDDPRERRRCVDCIAEIYADSTGLSHDLGRILALELAGYDHEQIARSEGRSVTGVRDATKRIRAEYSAEEERTHTLCGLLEYL